jgi:hypothetical protein
MRLIISLVFRILRRRPSVTRDDIVNKLMIRRQIPATYHSIFRVVPVSAMSERERKRKIMANTAKNPSTAVTDADNFRFFMACLFMKMKGNSSTKILNSLQYICLETLQNEMAGLPSKTITD